MKSVLQAVNLLTVAFGNVIVIIVAEAKAFEQVIDLTHKGKSINDVRPFLSFLTPFLLMHSRHARNLYNPKTKIIFEIAWTLFKIILFIHFYPLK